MRFLFYDGAADLMVFALDDASRVFLDEAVVVGGHQHSGAEFADSQ